MVAAERVPVCYGYGRHSTNKQELTQDAQEYRTHDYWERNLKPRGVEWGGFFYDAATSAKVPFSEREWGRNLVATVQPGDHIVVAKLDRPFRSLRDGIVSMELFAARNVSFHSLDLLIDTSTPLGRFFRNVLLAVAELEREFVSERVKETIALRKREGKPHGQGCPVGWKIKGEKPNRYYRVDANERTLVDAMSDLRKQGYSYDDIALWTMRQTVVQTKRTFSTRDTVKWALRAKRAGYPKVTNYKEFHRMVKSGEITLSPA